MPTYKAAMKYLERIDESVERIRSMLRELGHASVVPGAGITGF